MQLQSKYLECQQPHETPRIQGNLMQRTPIFCFKLTGFCGAFVTIQTFPYRLQNPLVLKLRGLRESLF